MALTNDAHVPQKGDRRGWKMGAETSFFPFRRKRNTRRVRSHGGAVAALRNSRYAAGSPGLSHVSFFFFAFFRHRELCLAHACALRPRKSDSRNILSLTVRASAVAYIVTRTPVTEQRRAASASAAERYAREKACNENANFYPDF